MAFGDLQTFLPRAEGSDLNVEQARAEGEKRADYLSSMDQFYEQLEETQRQFDLQQKLAERQFEWMSGFEEERLEQEGELGRERLELEGERVRIEGERAESEDIYREGLLGLERGRLDLERERSEQEFGLASSEQEFLQWLHGGKLGLEKKRFGLEQDVFELERSRLGESSVNTYTPAGAPSTIGGRGRNIPDPLGGGISFRGLTRRPEYGEKSIYR